jgi:DNA polymerase-3 subunit gamma/tau
VPAAALDPLPAAAAGSEGPDLAELWQQILAGLELPSTRMLLSQQAVLARLDPHRAVVQVAGNWMAMVQSRLPLLEKAVAGALGGNRQVLLEAAAGSTIPAAPTPAASAGAAPAPAAPPAPPPAATTAPPFAAPQQAVAPAEPASSQPVTPAASQPANPAASNSSAASSVAPAPRPGPVTPNLIDDKAKRLAEFFNGEVVQLDGPLPELLDGDEAAA